MSVVDQTVFGLGGGTPPDHADVTTAESPLLQVGEWLAHNVGATASTYVRLIGRNVPVSR